MTILFQFNKEKSAMINAITKSLMQCETVTKSPVSSSPSTSMAYSVQSPVSKEIKRNTQ